MSAFDKLQKYSSGLGKSAEKTTKLVESSEDAKALECLNSLYDEKSAVGFFLKRIHQMGYLVVEKVYKNFEGKTLFPQDYEALPVEERVKYSERFDLTELAKFILAKGDMLAIAGAGSGKTTALVFRIMKDILDGEATKIVDVAGNQIRVVDDIFVGTFLKSGADELKESVSKWQRKLGYIVTTERMQFGTLHAEFKRVLNAMGVKTPIGANATIEDCLKRSIDKYCISRSDGKNLTREDYQAIGGIVTFYRNRLGASRYTHPACDEYSLTPQLLDMLVQTFSQERGFAGVMDFEDLQELLYRYLYVTPNKAVQDFVANRYKYIYLDEFQDTSEIQYEIIKFYARGRLAINKGTSDSEAGLCADLITHEPRGGKIVAIGDDDQCIYSWRGSMIDVMCERFPADFKPEILTISRNYRCPSNILNPVISSITKNSKRYAKNLRSYKEGGEFYAYNFSSTKAMLANLEKQIDDDMQKGRSVAIICRTNFDGVIPAFLLEISHKYTFSVSSDGMTLNSPLPKMIMNACKLFMTGYSQQVRGILESLVGYHDKWGVKSLCDKLKSDASIGVRSSIFTLDMSDIAYSISPRFAQIIARMKSYLYDATGKKVKGGDILALRWLYFYMLSNVYDGDSSYCTRARAYIEAVLYLLESKDFENVYEFYDEISEYSERLKARVKKTGVKINIVTVHEFKGKERDCVYVWHDSDDYFPAHKTNLDIAEQVEEERRVHYIACTRASKKCVIYSLTRKHGMFLDEMSCKVVDPSTVAGSLSKDASSVGNSDVNSASSFSIVEDKATGKLKMVSNGDVISEEDTKKVVNSTSSEIKSSETNNVTEGYSVMTDDSESIAPVEENVFELPDVKNEA